MEMTEKSRRFWNSEAEPALRIERFWPDGKAESSELGALPEAIDIPNGASTIITLFDPSIKIRELDFLLSIEEAVAPDFDDFFLENLPKSHPEAAREIGTRWMGIDFEIKPVIVVPSQYSNHDYHEEVCFVVAAIPRNPLASADEPATLALLLRDNCFGDEELFEGERSLYFRWISGAPMSREDPSGRISSGGSACLQLGRGLWANYPSVDSEESFSITRLVGAEESTVLQKLVDWTLDCHLETWLAISGLFGTPTESAFPEEELRLLTASIKRMSNRIDMGSTSCINAEIFLREPLRSRYVETLRDTPNVAAVCDFFKNPGYHLHSAMFNMIIEAAQNERPGPIVQAANLEDALRPVLS
jgi:hypothetical protein